MSKEQTVPSVPLAPMPRIAAAMLTTVLVTLAAWQAPYSTLMWAMPLVCVLLTRILFFRRKRVPLAAALPVIGMLVLWRVFDFGAYLYYRRASLALGRRSALVASWCALTISIFVSALLGTYLRRHSSRSTRLAQPAARSAELTPKAPDRR